MSARVEPSLFLLIYTRFRFYYYFIENSRMSLKGFEIADLNKAWINKVVQSKL